MTTAMQAETILLCDPTRWMAAVERIAALDPAAGMKKRPAYSVTDNGMAIVDACGVLYAGADAAWEEYGVQCPNRLLAKVAQAQDDEMVDKVLINWDSPGGAVTCIDECAHELAEMNENGKPVISYTGSMMASAAYYIASGSQMIVASKSAHVGSIGVYTAHIDATSMYERMGMAIEVFRSGKLKGAGAYNTALTKEQRAEIQSQIDQLAEQFKGFVTSNRPMVNESSMQGQSFIGKAAADANIVDHLVTGINQLTQEMQ